MATLGSVLGANLLRGELSTSSAEVRWFSAIREGIEWIGEAVDGQRGIALAAALRPNVIVLDQMMPNMAGTEAIPHLRAVAPQARVVLRSALRDVTLGSAAVEAGADCSVQKGDIKELLAAIVGTTTD